MSNIKITCCKKSVVVADAERENLGRACELFGFSHYQEDPSLKFYENAGGGNESEYTAILEPTNEPLTQNSIVWGE